MDAGASNYSCYSWEKELLSSLAEIPSGFNRFVRFLKSPGIFHANTEVFPPLGVV
jgi:hypothetical protein